MPSLVHCIVNKKAYPHFFCIHPYLLYVFIGVDVHYCRALHYINIKITNNDTVFHLLFSDVQLTLPSHRQYYAVWMSSVPSCWISWQLSEIPWDWALLGTQLGLCCSWLGNILTDTTLATTLEDCCLHVGLTSHNVLGIVLDGHGSEHHSEMHSFPAWMPCALVQTVRFMDVQDSNKRPMFTVCEVLVYSLMKLEYTQDLFGGVHKLY